MFHKEVFWDYILIYIVSSRLSKINHYRGCSLCWWHIIPIGQVRLEINYKLALVAFYVVTVTNWNKCIKNWGNLFYFMPPEIKVNNTAINWPHSVRYSGVVSDKRLTFSAHMNYASLKVNKTTRAIYPLFNCKPL